MITTTAAVAAAAVAATASNAKNIYRERETDAETINDDGRW